MRKTTISKKGAKEEMKKTTNLTRRGQKKEVLNLRSYFFDSFLPSRAPERPPRRWGAAEGGVACSRGKTAIFEKKRARASAAAHFSKLGRETSG